MKQRGVAATLFFLILFKSTISQKDKDDERINSRRSTWSSNLRDVLETTGSQMEEAASNLPSINDVSQNLLSQIKEAVDKLPAPIKEAASKLPSKVNDFADDLQFSDMIEKIAPDIDTRTKKKIVYGMAGAGAALGTAAVALPALGFTASGVEAGSIAAGVQSVVSGGVGATAFGALQSAGAAGMAVGTKAFLAEAGAYAAQKFMDLDRAEIGYTENEDADTEKDEGDRATDANESNGGAQDRLSFLV